MSTLYPTPRKPLQENTWADGFRFAITLACEAVCPFCERTGQPERVHRRGSHWWHEHEAEPDEPARLCLASPILRAVHFQAALEGPE